MTSPVPAATCRVQMDPSTNSEKASKGHKGPPTSPTVVPCDENTIHGITKYIADEFHWCPPPCFILCTVIIEIISFAYFAIEAGTASDSSIINVLAQESILIYRPDARGEIWRFFTYCLIHANWMHLLFNLIFQIGLGVPLESVHGSGRVAIIFMAGVLAGSLATSVFNPTSMLIGVSSGLYAILAGHLANLILNYDQMKWAPVRLLGIFLCALFDFAFAIYDKYCSLGDKAPISFIAHLAGTVCGLTVGLIVLKNFHVKWQHQLIWWSALGVYCSIICAGLLYNLIHPMV